MQEEDFMNAPGDDFWKSEFRDFVHTHSLAMRSVFAKVKAVAPTKTTVLLIGETGTGKGILSKIIHYHSNRSERQFLNVHCGALSENLLESELFGHEKGAFTGAIRRKLGKFELAQGGTIFLDEVGTITQTAQIKLLQVLQDKILQRVGGEETIETDVRVIAATNVDLEEMLVNSSFRKDLFYRLSVFPIEIPPLRERTEDIPFLVNFFLKRLNQFYLKGIEGIDEDLLEILEKYPWPGNLRELENLVERAYILESSSKLKVANFPMDLLSSKPWKGDSLVDIALPLAQVRKHAWQEIERRYLVDLLAFHKGRIDKSAMAAGITTRQLHKLLRRYGIRKELYKNSKTQTE